MTEDEFRDLRRRSRKCCAHEAVLLERHRDKAADRISMMIGWHIADIFDEEEDDLSWWLGFQCFAPSSIIIDAYGNKD